MAPNQTIRYDKPSDWDSWHDALLLKARALHLRPYLLGEEEEPLKPTKPLMADYPRIAPPAVELPPSSSTRSATPAPSGIMGLTEHGRADYQHAKSEYQLELQQYELFASRYTTLQDWIMETLGGSYRKRWCGANLSIPTWYQRLSDGASSFTDTRNQDALTNYRVATKPLRAMPKNFEQWIGRWEEAMAEANNHELIEVQNATRWYKDLEDALRDVQSSVIEGYYNAQKQAIKDNTLNYQDTVAHLRARCVHAKPAPAKYTHGSFATTEFSEVGEVGESFAVHDLEEHDESNGGSAPTPKPKPNRPKTNKRQGKRAFPGNEANDTPLAKRIQRPNQRPAETPIRSAGQKKCPLCVQNHALEVCFYIIPPKTLRWTPNRGTLLLIEEKLEKDPGLKAAVERIKRDAE